MTVEGHTDNVPIAFSDRFNQLGFISGAVCAVADYLLGNTEIQQGRLTVTGYADTKPLESNETLRDARRIVDKLS